MKQNPRFNRVQRSAGLRAATMITLWSFVATSCGSKTSTTASTAGGSATPATHALVQTGDIPKGLDMRLSNGKAGVDAADRSKLAPATKLGDADVAALLSRAKPLAADKNDRQDFALRAKSLPPPRTGKVEANAFPAPPSSLLPPKTNEVGKALTVLRYMPEGDVPLAPELSVTFSDAMVAVTSQDDAAAVQPVKITPQPAGKWRWIGTRTILFDPAVRFPQATTYKVEIAAGTKSVNGNELKKPVSFSFTTPPPKVVNRYPNGDSHRTDVPMFASFDQQIDAAALTSILKVTANGKAYAVRQLDAAEIEKDATIKSLVATANDNGRNNWVAFRALDAFPTDTAVTVEFPVGTPSAEGPNKTIEAQTLGFRTYPPLKIERAECGYQKKCPPGQPFSIQFNNSLDMDKFVDQQITVTPDVPGLKVLNYGNSVNLQGATIARSTYKVKVSSTIVDEYGQTLGKDQEFDWNVTEAYPAFFGPQGVVVLDPAAKSPSIDMFTVNYDLLKYKLYKVTPAEFPAFGDYMRNLWNKDKPPTMPGSKVFDGSVPTTQGKDRLVETKVDLSKALGAGGVGHVIAVIEPSPWKEKYDPPRMYIWVQATKLGIDASVDNELLLAFATELQTGKPAAGVDVRLARGGVSAKSDSQGLATLQLPAGGGRGTEMLIVKRGNDEAFVTESNGWWNDYNSWVKQAPSRSLTAYVVDDRKLYKPGEEVSIKGWLRLVDNGKNGDVNGIGGEVSSVTYDVFDSVGNKMLSGSAPVNMLGGFDTKFKLPTTPNLGYTSVQFRTVGKRVESFYHQFQTEEFRRPEFEVSATASQAPNLIGGSGDLTVNAKYFAGGPLAGADVTWQLSASETTFTPPNRDEFIFGKWVPWWGYRGGYDYDDEGGFYGGRGGRYTPAKSWTHEAKTDGAGAHVLHMDFLSANPAVPMSVSANVSVMDVNRQAWNAGAALLVHPSSLYVGVRTKRPFVDKGTPFAIDVIGVDLEGKAVPGSKISLKTVRKDYEYKKGKYVEKDVDPQTCEVISTADVSKCEFATKVGGSYETVATILDSKGRANTTTITFWVTGGDRLPSRDVKREEAQIIPDKKEYQQGDVAELLIMSPFAPAEALVTWRRSGIVKTERLTLQGSTAVVKVPITDAMVPNLYVHVDLVGEAPRLNDKGDADPALPKRVAYAGGEINLPIPPKRRTLTVTATPNATKFSPGETAKISVDVKDVDGRPVADAETTVIVVDEAVLSLTGYQFPNPVGSFYPQRGSDTRDVYLRGMVKLANPTRDQLAQNQNGMDGDADGIATGGRAERSGASRSMAAPSAPSATISRADGAPAPPVMAPSPKGAPSREKSKESKPSPDEPAQSNGPVALRTNFNPLAAFSPTVKTDANGKATLDVKLPDNLTRYRVVVLAAAGERNFGKGESAITARLPLMVRPSPPRFLNFGDTFKLPVVLQNQTDAPLKVKLAMRTTNATLTDGAGREVMVPANDRVEVQFPAAAEMAGTARFQFIGASGGFSDAAELALPVWTPATTEAFATYGTIDDGAIRQPVALPGKVVTQFGGLEITTASTNLQALTDAVLYLVAYPFECAEQRASRILAIAALRDVLTAFKVENMPTPAEMEARVAADIERLTQMQNGDGGFAFWERGRPSWPFLTVHVANALVRAKLKGFTVPAPMLNRAMAYLKDIESHYDVYYSDEVRWSISSYALYVRKLNGDIDISKAQKLLATATLPKLPMEATGWLLGTLAGQKAAETERKAIVRHVMNKVSETAGAANFTTAYKDGAHLILSSNHRVDGIMLESLIQEQKDLDLIPKVVTGLLAHRKAGRWLNTGENAFALLALDLYFRTYEKVTPDFVARMWLGADYAGDHTFKGRTTEYSQTSISMKDVAAHDKSDLIIQKDGKGRLYYRIGMIYAPADLKLAAADYGFVIERKYEGVDNAADVSRDANGTWKVKAGARVRVKLTMVNENRRYHVALVDPLPAGLEPMNPALATTGPIPMDNSADKSMGPYWWWYGPWYEHQNMRDERVEAFASMLWPGVHTYQYVTRATTPGNFVVPPTKAEEMYMPETFGRGASDRVIVE